MESKKSSKVDLENKRNMFFLFGLVAALGATFLAFEWTTKPGRAESLGSVQSQTVEEEFIPVTREQEVQPPPPPPPPKTVEILNIVDNNITIDNELKIDDTGADETTIIEVNPVVQAVKEREEKEPDIFYIVEDPAQFPGGEKALYQYIQNTVKYPVIAQENGVMGKVYVKFVVNESGKISNAEILRGVDPSLDSEALRVINSLPDFKPGKQRGRPVKVFYNAVINFQLQ